MNAANPLAVARVKLTALVILLGAVLVSACAVAPTAGPPGERWELRRAALASLQDWSLVGNMGVLTEQQGWHASFQWSQEGQRYRIDLIGPFGQGQVRIEGDGQGVRVRTAAGQVLTAADPEQLLEDAVGVRIPVDGLRYWVRGLPDPHRRSVLADDGLGRLTRLEQGGWVVEYPRYMPVAALELPAQIRARKGDLNVKIVIQQWNLPW